MTTGTKKLLWAEELTIEICRLRIAADICMGTALALAAYSVIGTIITG